MGEMARMKCGACLPASLDAVHFSPARHTTYPPTATRVTHRKLIQRVVPKLGGCKEEALAHEADGGGGGDSVEIFDTQLCRREGEAEGRAAGRKRLKKIRAGHQQLNRRQLQAPKCGKQGRTAAANSVRDDGPVSVRSACMCSPLTSSPS